MQGTTQSAHAVQRVLVYHEVHQPSATSIAHGDLSKATAETATAALPAMSWRSTTAQSVYLEVDNIGLPGSASCLVHVMHTPAPNQSTALPRAAAAVLR